MICLTLVIVVLAIIQLSPEASWLLVAARTKLEAVKYDNFEVIGKTMVKIRS